jgi:hypothetical protein
MATKLRRQSFSDRLVNWHNHNRLGANRENGNKPTTRVHRPTTLNGSGGISDPYRVHYARKKDYFEDPDGEGQSEHESYAP